MTDPIKNPTTYEQQLAKLKSRGCTIKEYKNDIDLTHIAFPSDWVDLLTKKIIKA